MKRKVFLAFALSYGLVIAAMASVSLLVIQQDRAQRLAMQKDEKEELVRLALWRMDAALSTIVTQESTRPFAQFDRTYAVTYQPEKASKPQTMLLPSPLLNDEIPMVNMHFRINPDNSITVPYDNNTLQSNPKNKDNRDKPMLDEKWEFQKQLAMFNMAKPLRELLPQAPEKQVIRGSKELNQLINQNPQPSPKNQRDQQQRNDAEQQKRIESQNTIQSQNIGQYAQDIYEPTREGETRKMWYEGNLIVGRKVINKDEEYVVGCWLNWPDMQAWLENMIVDLLPDSSLHPVKTEDNRTEPNHLASLPVRLDPGNIESTVGLDSTGPMLLLSIAWSGIIIAGIAVAVLLGGVTALGERRKTFATAVTHELRTPLTSMRMYTEMLSDGMVHEADKREQYITTLHGETIRLCDLVENVLSFGKLESTSSEGEKILTGTGDFTDRLVPRLEERTSSSGMQLMVDIPEDCRAKEITINPTAIEQIIVNLVDNACKYAADALDNRIHLDIKSINDKIEFCVRDHGPGVSPDEIKKIFRPFFKAKKDNAGTRGGVGLGLALCKRIAKKNGGKITYRPGSGNGACFCLLIQDH